MKLLAFFQVGVILCKTLEREFIRKSDKLWVGNMSVQEVLYLNWICCRVHHNLSVWGHHLQDILDVNLEIHGKQLVDFIQHKEIALV